MASDLYYPERIELGLYPTPLKPMKRLTRELEGPQLWIKRDDMCGVEMSGNKARKLEFLLAEAQQQDCVVAITAGGRQSNHCRATAAACARLGMECHLVLRSVKTEPPFDGNLLLDKLFGSKITYLSQIEFAERSMDVINDLIDEYKTKGKRAYYFPIGGSTPLGAWGYIRAMEEIAAQMKTNNIASGHVVTACGSGGTAVGLMLGQALHNVPLKVWAVPVCDNLEYWQKELHRQMAETIAFYSLDLNVNDLVLNLLDGYIGQGYAIPYPEELEIISKAAKLEGFVLDPVYTGKAFYGLVDQIKQGNFGKNDTIIFVHTGGIFGNFPLRDHFTF